MYDAPDPALAAAMRAVYEVGAEGYDRQRARVLFERPWLERFRARLSPGATVLDLGCGGGEPMARWLIEAGHPIVGVDFSEAMLAIVRARFPEQTWIHADMRELDLGQRFGGIIAWDSFFHLTRDAQRAMFPILARHLTPGGILMFTSGPDAGEATGTVEGRAVYHASLAPSEYASLMQMNGILPRAYIADDPDCDNHSVWLGQAVV